MEDYVAAFRCYEWDEDIERLAELFFSHTPGSRQVVLADETRGLLPIPDRFEKISHTADTSAYGLANYPQPSLWFNVDYGPIILQQKLPGYAHYLFSESDLAVNLSLSPMMQQIRREEIDFVALDVRKAEPGWDYFHNARESFDDPWRSLLFFMVFSQRAIKELGSARRAQSARFAAQPDVRHSWPFCESFVPTVLHNAGMKHLPLEQFAETSMLRFRPRLPTSNPAVFRPGSLVHSVVSPEKYVKALIKDNGPRSYFDTIDQENGFRWIDEEIVVRTVRNAFIETRDHAALARIERETRKIGSGRIMENLAFLKPALVSSTCRWSNAQDPAIEACGANGADVPGDFGFHTDQEDQPWWSVDLQAECLVEAVEIVNRTLGQNRFRSFAIESSRTGTAWATRYNKFDAMEVSADPDTPWTVQFDDPFLARHVRIRSLALNAILHLRYVRIIGTWIRESSFS